MEIKHRNSTLTILILFCVAMLFLTSCDILSKAHIIDPMWIGVWESTKKITLTAEPEYELTIRKQSDDWGKIEIKHNTAVGIISWNEKYYCIIDGSQIKCYLTSLTESLPLFKISYSFTDNAEKTQFTITEISDKLHSELQGLTFVKKL